MNHTWSMVLIGVLSAASGGALATTAVDSILSCRAETNEARRLACYDAVADTLHEVQAASTIDEFGRELVHPHKDVGRKVDSIADTILRAVEQPHGTWQLWLESGQVWRELVANRRSEYSTGDVVNISRGALNSYRLKSERTGRVAKVKRVR